LKQLNIFSFNEEVFIDCNGNGPYDNLFNNLKRFTIKNEAGTAVLDGYFLSTSSTPGTA